MTPHEIDLAAALGRVSGWVGSRFLRDVASVAQNTPGAEVTLRQRHYMEIMAWRYRRQLPHHLVPDKKPLSLPAKRKEPKPRKVATSQVGDDGSEQLPLL